MSLNFQSILFDFFIFISRLENWTILRGGIEISVLIDTFCTKCAWYPFLFDAFAAERELLIRSAA